PRAPPPGSHDRDGHAQPRDRGRAAPRARDERREDHPRRSASALRRGCFRFRALRRGSLRFRGLHLRGSYLTLERALPILGQGLRGLRRNKLRSFLTMLGMIFGVGSVITMLSVGAGARAEILARIGELGVTNIIMNSVKPPEETKPENTNQWLLRYGLTF